MTDFGVPYDDSDKSRSLGFHTSLFTGGGVHLGGLAEYGLTEWFSAGLSIGYHYADLSQFQAPNAGITGINALPIGLKLKFQKRFYVRGARAYLALSPFYILNLDDTTKSLFYVTPSLGFEFDLPYLEKYLSFFSELYLFTGEELNFSIQLGFKY